MLKLYKRHGITLGKAPSGLKDIDEAEGGADGHDVR
jgi:hypothetical protein